MDASLQLYGPAASVGSGIVPNIVGSGSTSASPIGGVAPGAISYITLSMSQALAGDTIAWSFDAAPVGSALGGMAFAGSFVISGTVYISFVNTDPVNPSSSFAGINLYATASRP